MFAILYLTIFVTSLMLVIRDKDFETVQQPCLVCMPRHFILLSLGCLFVGAEAFALFAPRLVWVISGVMTLSISGFLFGIFCMYERNKRILAGLQIVYVILITVHFYTWWWE